MAKGCQIQIGSIFETAIGKDILAILSFARGERLRSHLIRFMNKPVRYIPRRILPEKEIDLCALAKADGITAGTASSLLRLAGDLKNLQKMWT